MNEKNYLDSFDVESQENLSNSILKNMVVDNKRAITIHETRPTDNFVDLMGWAANTFGSVIDKEKKSINKFIHNRIIIDGQFLLFCKENKLTVECLYKDSIISWKTDHNFEKFFMQGVFLIKSANVEFIHCALFHKGNQYEDEISFFILVNDKNYENYLKIRNQFDEWVQQRDRGNLHIRVIDGEDLPYTKDHSWDDLFLPQDIKGQIKGLVENFLSSRDFYIQNKIPWKRGILLYGKPGCHAIGTNILMYDGTWKKVEDVIVGDFLMGPDSQPREVLQLVRGNEKMYDIIPNKGKSFVVNQNHILHLNYSSKGKGCPSSVNISVNEYLNLSKPLKEKLKLVKSNMLEFDGSKLSNNKLDDYELDPYILGVWLGDGTTGKPEFTSADSEIIEYIEKYAILNNLNFHKRKNTNSKAYNISLSAKKGEKNIFTQALRKLGIFEKKCIPDKYLTSNINCRRQLLAGIIDTDGSYNCISWRKSEKYKKIGIKGCFDLIQKDRTLSEQVGFLVHSLGLGFTIKPCVKTIKSIGFSGNYFRMSIYGDIFNIPTKLPRKQALVGRANKDCKNIGIRSINDVGNMDYYGFVVDKDHLYVMDDFWVTHNCGKTSIVRTIMSVYNFKPVTIVAEATNEIVREAFSYAEEQSPSLLYFEDLDSLFDKGVDISTFLNLMDGIASKNGLLVIATANEVKKLKANITDRPSRFDRKFEIPLPNQEMAYIYLNKWFGNLLTVKKCRELAKYAEKYEFSYAYLKELYVSAMFEALSHNRKVPNVKDIDTALSHLVKDKNILNNNKINTDKYFK